jgi:hypothetical protein
MKYGVVVSKDSFVFTRHGILSVGQLSSDSQILGVQGIGKNAKYEKVTLYQENNPVKGIRLVTQATDSLLLPQTFLFSEKVVEAKNVVLASEIEFYNPSEIQELDNGRVESTDLDSESIYCLGLLNSKIIETKKCLVFLIHSATEHDYVKHLEDVISNPNILLDPKVKAKLKIGKLGHLWIIIKGEEVGKIQKVVSSFPPERVCMKMDPEQVRHYVAGMLDAYICKPFYGDEPVLRFFARESFQKRFLQNMLILYGYRIVETSCITNHSPKFLESKAIVGKKIPVENPLWDSISEFSKEPARALRLFSRIRASMEITTAPARIIFQEHGFSPIIDGLYAYPQLLST